MMVKKQKQKSVSKKLISVPETRQSLMLKAKAREFEGLGGHYLWAEDPKENHVDRREDDEEKVIFPADGSEPCGRGLKEWQGRQEEDWNAPAHSLRTNVGREYFGAVDIECGIDKAGIATGRVSDVSVISAMIEDFLVTYKQM